MKNIKKYDLELYECLELELTREKNTLELIASENFTSKKSLAIFTPAPLIKKVSLRFTAPIFTK